MKSKYPLIIDSKLIHFDIFQILNFNYLPYKGGASTQESCEFWKYPPDFACSIGSADSSARACSH